MFGRKQKHVVYPSKRHMNLYYKMERTAVPSAVLLCSLSVFAILLVLSKFFVFDLVQEERQTKRELESAREQLQECQAQVMDYEDVAFTYSRYAATEEEAAQVDRVQILDLLDQAVRSRSQVLQVTVSGGTVTVNISVRTLRETAQIVRELEASPIVERTMVNTAAAAPGEDSMVSADILIELVKRGEQQGEEDASE